MKVQVAGALWPTSKLSVIIIFGREPLNDCCVCVCSFSAHGEFFKNRKETHLVEWWAPGDWRSTIRLGNRLVRLAECADDGSRRRRRQEGFYRRHERGELLGTRPAGKMGAIIRKASKFLLLILLIGPKEKKRGGRTCHVAPCQLAAQVTIIYRRAIVLEKGGGGVSQICWPPPKQLSDDDDELPWRRLSFSLLFSSLSAFINAFSSFPLLITQLEENKKQKK